MIATDPLVLNGGRPRIKPSAVGFGVSLVAGISAVVALVWMGEIIVNSGRGLDASDESYYLLAAQFPHSSTTSATGFDSYLSLLWRLCGRSVALYRVAGLFLLTGSVVVAALCAVSALRSHVRTSAVGACVAVILIPLTLTTYVFWVLTPSYNLLVLVVTLLAGGLTARLALTAAASDDNGRKDDVMLAAFGFCMTIGLVAKGPAFAVIGVLSVTAITIVRGLTRLTRGWKPLCVGFGGGLLAFVALTGLPMGIVHRFLRGFDANALLGSHTPETMWEVTAVRHVYGPWFLLFFVGASLLALAWRWVRSDVIRLAITGVGGLATALVFAQSLPLGGAAGVAGTAGWWWIRLTSMMLLWSTANARGVSRELVVGPLISLMAVGAAAGSANGIVRQVAFMVGVLGLGLVVQCLNVAASRNELGSAQSRELDLRRTLGLVPAAAFFIVGCVASNHMLESGINAPYRLLGPLSAENEAVDLGAFGSLDVNPATAEYIHSLQAIATRVPPGARDCLVDLAGGTPLSAIALGMMPATVPWLLGGYPGSTDFAEYVLDDAPCLVGGYVLIEAPGGQRSIDRPGNLDASNATLLGRVRYEGYLDEEQEIWLVPPAP